MPAGAGHTNFHSSAERKPPSSVGRYRGDRGDERSGGGGRGGGRSGHDYHIKMIKNKISFTLIYRHFFLYGTSHFHTNRIYLFILNFFEFFKFKLILLKLEFLLVNFF